MQGYLISFVTHQDRKHAGLPLAEWLIQRARQLNIGGATVIAAAEGFGHTRKLHSAHFFELGDQPVEVQIALSEDDAQRLFQCLAEEGIKVFYTKTPIEFGVTG